MTKIPDWALEHKKPGTEIKAKEERFYLYEVSSVWDKVKKRAQKRSGKYLGRITESGFIPKVRHYSKAGDERSALGLHASDISVREYGASNMILNNLVTRDFTDSLQEHFSCIWQEILSISILRTVWHCPMKNMESLYRDSYLSAFFRDLKLSGKDISSLMQDLGRQRDKIVSFMKRLICGSENIVFDMTDIISSSKRLGINALGKTNSGFDTKLNLLYVFSVDQKSPLYYRILPGNIKDVSSLKLSLEELGLDNITIVADKGFTSKDNIETMKQLGIKFIMPLKRDSKMINYKKLQTGNLQKLGGYFIHEGRPIWHYSTNLKKEKLKVFVFQDDKLKTEERRDYLTRLEEGYEGYTSEKFYETEVRFGTIAIVTDAKNNMSAEEAYRSYKARMQVENLFDTFKNVLEADRTYASNTANLEAWMFFNHIAMMFLYDIYRRLVSSELIKTYSVSDILMLLTQVRMLKIGGTWSASEMPKKLAGILQKLDLKLGLLPI